MSAISLTLYDIVVRLPAKNSFPKSLSSNVNIHRYAGWSTFRFFSSFLMYIFKIHKKRMIEKFYEIVTLNRVFLILFHIFCHVKFWSPCIKSWKPKNTHLLYPCIILYAKNWLFAVNTQNTNPIWLGTISVIINRFNIKLINNNMLNVVRYCFAHNINFCSKLLTE